MSQQISQSTNSPTMKVILVQSKFILFRVVDSISFPFLKDFPPYNHTQCHRGMVSKMATPTANILHLFLLLPLHFGLPFVLPALLALKLVYGEFLVPSVSTLRTCTQAEGRRSPVVVQATVKQHAACATRTGSGVQSTVIGALGSVLTRQQAQNIPRLRSYSNRTMVRWSNRILGVLNWVHSISLVVARSLFLIASSACD